MHWSSRAVEFNEPMFGRAVIIGINRFNQDWFPTQIIRLFEP